MWGRSKNKEEVKPVNKNKEVPKPAGKDAGKKDAKHDAGKKNQNQKKDSKKKDMKNKNQKAMTKQDQAAIYTFYISISLIAMIPFLFRSTANFLVNVIGFVYPTFCSMVTILKKNQELTKRWLIYWIVYAIFMLAQRMCDVFLSKIPFYPLLQAICLLMLMHYPYANHATLAEYIYYTHIAPNVGHAALKADYAFQEAVSEFKRDPKAFAGQLLQGNENRADGLATHQDGSMSTLQQDMSIMEDEFKLTQEDMSLNDLSEESSNEGTEMTQLTDPNEAGSQNTSEETNADDPNVDDANNMGDAENSGDEEEEEAIKVEHGSGQIEDVAPNGTSNEMVSRPSSDENLDLLTAAKSTAVNGRSSNNSCVSPGLDPNVIRSSKEILRVSSSLEDRDIDVISDDDEDGDHKKDD